MRLNLDAMRWAVVGYKTRYSTHGHIHGAFYRTLDKTGKSVTWVEPPEQQYLRASWENVIVITNHDVAMQIPFVESSFYFIHGGGDHPEIRAKFGKNMISWNVYHDFSHGFGMGLLPINRPLDPNAAFLLAEDTPFWPVERHMDFRWATNLVPSEIEALKPNTILGRDSDVINYVGTLWHVNKAEIADFKRAVEEDKKRFVMAGAGQNGIITDEDNIRLIRESFMAPAISGTHHLTEGYAPCRIFKNISYGQPGITNSQRVQDIFKNTLIFSSDCYRLYWEAKEKLQDFTLQDLHNQMDFVSKNHTYVNRIEKMIEAAKITEAG